MFIIEKPFDCDLYTIIMIDGVKCISVKCSIIEETDGTWIYDKQPLLIVSLEYFISSGKDSDIVCAQYYEEGRAVNTDNDGIINLINTFFDGEPAHARVDYSDITMDIPCGNYIAKTQYQ